MSRHYTYAIGEFRVALNNCECELRSETDERARWFAAQLREWVKLAGEVYHASLSADTWVKVREFQLQEIKDAIQATRDRLDKLEAQELALMPKLESAINDRAEANAEKAMQERA